jgi:hypothetical protein
MQLYLRSSESTRGMNTCHRCLQCKACNAVLDSLTSSLSHSTRQNFLASALREPPIFFIQNFCLKTLIISKKVNSRNSGIEFLDAAGSKGSVKGHDMVSEKPKKGLCGASSRWYYRSHGRLQVPSLVKKYRRDSTRTHHTRLRGYSVSRRKRVTAAR